MSRLAVVNTLSQDEKILLLHQLMNELLPTGEVTYPQRQNGKIMPTIAEEAADYEVSTPRTFQDYFKLNLPSEQIAAMLGYTYRRQALNLAEVPVSSDVIDAGRLANLLERIDEGLQHVGMYSEMARREFMIAPTLLETIHYTKAHLWVEYNIKASDSLQGSLDYLLRSKQQLLVVEAKQGDLQRGFHQLMAELAALDLQDMTNSEQLFGIVSMGDGWQFGRLDRSNKLITQDTEHYGIPINIELLIKIMIGILQRNEHAN
ncbi:MAG: hypothetical protein KDE19_23455 [Caldilineaceae bacterium]|nr:hypothetical protein [Caldilineaceae bacterium]